MNPAPAFAPPRVAANLSHAFGGVWRLTFRRFIQLGRLLVLLGALGVLGLLCYGSGRLGGDAGGYVGWVCGFYLTFLVPAVAFLSAAGAMRDEMKPGTADYVLTRPLPRPVFVAFKYLAHTACAQIDLLCALAVVFGVGAVGGGMALAAALPQILFCQVLLVAAFGALGFLFAAITTRYFALGLLYAGLIEAGVGQIPTQLSRLSMTHQVRAFLAPLLGRADAAAAPGWFLTAALLLAFAAVMLAATAALFALREPGGPADA